MTSPAQSIHCVLQKVGKGGYIGNIAIDKSVDYFYGAAESNKGAAPPQQQTAAATVFGAIQNMFTGNKTMAEKPKPTANSTKGNHWDPTSHRSSQAGLAADSCPLYVLLDQSGSMEGNVNRIVTKILPAFMTGLGYSPSAKLHLILFGSVVKTFNMTIPELQKSRLRCAGGTRMAPGVAALGQAISNSDPASAARVLVLSDGALDDQSQTLQQSSALAEEFRSSGKRVNAHAVRFFTSAHQPDTRGLASVMQFNNVDAKPELLDISSKEKDTVIVDMLLRQTRFAEDGLTLQLKLQAGNSGEKILRTLPWVEPEQCVNVKPGDNWIWFTELPQRLALIGPEGKQVEVSVETSQRGPMTLHDVSDAGPMSGVMANYCARLKLLKVIGTPDALAEVQSIVHFVDDLQTELAASESRLSDILSTSKVTAARLQHLRALAARRKTSILGRMKEIANDEKVSALNSAQQAEYLRDLQTNDKGSRALARRAVQSGLDFTNEVMSCIRKMREHIHELDGIDDSTHSQSFYSLETTLSSIKAVCAVADEDLEELSATDLIQSIGLVGVPVAAQTGNFPDPMTYRIETVMPSARLSLADLLTALVATQEPVHAPGFPNVEVTNVIPVFDDLRIDTFMRRHAAKLLELISSIGMRRIVADVPHTYAYTMAAAAMGMMIELKKAPTESNRRLFTEFVRGYYHALDGRFNYIVNLILSPKQNTGGIKVSRTHTAERQVFLQNNGTTNCLIPLMQVHQGGIIVVGDETTRDAKITSAISMAGESANRHVPASLRTLYSFEVYQYVRKLIKKNPQEYAQEKIHQLLGLTAEVLERNATPTQPLFVEEPREPVIFSELSHVGDSNAVYDLNEILNAMYWLDFTALAPSIFDFVGGKAGCTHLSCTATDICEALGLEIGFSGDAEKTLRQFKLCNVIMALEFSTQNLRSDTDSKVMLVPDLPSIELQQQYLSHHVWQIFERQYKLAVLNKTKQQQHVVVDSIVTRLVSTPSMREFCEILRDGASRGEGTAMTTMCISDTRALGYLSLWTRLMAAAASGGTGDENATAPTPETVPHCLEKLMTLVLGGRHSENPEGFEVPVFNSGNVLRGKHLEEMEAMLEHHPAGGPKVLEELRTQWKAFCRHVYRDGPPNRHSHNEEKRSYAAMGFATLQEYLSSSAYTDAEKAEYIRQHWNCCGVGLLEGQYTRRKDRWTLCKQSLD